MSATAEKIEVGAKAPHLTVTIETGDILKLDSLYDKGYVLIYFYPKADTPGCTAQACSLRDAFVELEKKGVTVLGASSDGVADQLAFKKKYRLPFHLVSDTKGELAQALEVPMQGTYMSRQAFLFSQGKLIWLDRKASTKEQAQDVLNVLAGKAAPNH